MHGDLHFKANTGQTAVDEAQGIVECFVAAIGNKDSVGDIILPGAFEASFKKRKPRVVWGHDWNSPIGKVLDIYEVGPSDPRMPEKMRKANVGGIYARVQFNLKSERGREAFANVQFFGEEQEWSIGYKTLEAEWNGEVQANVLKELELYEVSPVLHGANQLTGTISIKQDKLKDPKGGLTAAGRRHYERTEGAKLKPGVKGPADTPEKKRRKGSFLTRFFTNPSGPMKKPNGDPTRLALSAAAWGEPVPKNRSDAAKLAAKGRRLLEQYKKTKKKDADFDDFIDADFDDFAEYEDYFHEEFVEMAMDQMKSVWDEDFEDFEDERPADVDIKRAPSAADLDVITDAVGLDIPQERITGDVLRGYGPRRGNLERLLRYWRPIMRKPGGFRRCRVILADHPELYPLENLCAWLHHETTGLWPNEGCHHPGMKNCRNKPRKGFRGSLFSNEEFEKRMRKLRKKKKDALMDDDMFDADEKGWGPDVEDMDDDALIAKFVEALRDFVEEEPSFLDFLSDDNWVHEGQDDDDEWVEHNYLVPMKRSSGGCGCGGSCGGGKPMKKPKKMMRRMKSDAPSTYMVKSDDPFGLESDISPVLDYHNIDRMVSMEGIALGLVGVDPESIKAVATALENLGEKAIGRGLRRSAGGYNPDAIDGDNDGTVQEGTAFERPAVEKVSDAMKKVTDIVGRALNYYEENKDKDWKPGSTMKRAQRGGLEGEGDIGKIVEGPKGFGIISDSTNADGSRSRFGADGESLGEFEVTYTHDLDGNKLDAPLVETIDYEPDDWDPENPIWNEDFQTFEFYGDDDDFRDEIDAMMDDPSSPLGKDTARQAEKKKRIEQVGQFRKISSWAKQNGYEMGPMPMRPGDPITMIDADGKEIGFDEIMAMMNAAGGKSASAPMKVHNEWAAPVVKQYGIPYSVKSGRVFYQTEKITPSAKSDLYNSLRKAKGAKTEVKRDYSDETRKNYAKRGFAMPDGSYPIRDVGDLRNAIQAFGRAKNKPATKKHIIKRARQLGAVELLPKQWKK